MSASTSAVRKAVVPVAGLGTRLLPATKSQPKEMLPVGRKPVVQYVVEEMERASAREICFVTGRGKRAIEDHFDRDESLASFLTSTGHGALLEELAFEQLPVHLFYTRQAVPRGLGDAVLHAEQFVGGEDFIVALGDTIIRSREDKELVQRLAEVHMRQKAVATIAVEEVDADEAYRYGIVKPAGQGMSFPITDLVEKPPVATAPSRFAIAARYVFAPAVFDAIRRTLPDRQGDVQLTDAIRVLLSQGQPVWAVRLRQGERRYDIGNFETYFKAFIDFAADDEKYGHAVRHHIHQMATNGGNLLMPDSITIRASAPGRCGIVGNPTDMYGGSVLSCSIPRRARVTLQEADSLILETVGQTIELRDRTDFHIRGDRFDVPRAVLSHLRLDNLKVRLTYESDIPYRGGLSSSTALIAAVLWAVLRYQGVTHHKHHFAELARYVELNRMGIVCGYQDAYMVTFGGLNYIEFRDKEFYRTVADEPYASVESLNGAASSLPFIVAHTGLQHSSGAVHKPLRERWLDGEPAVVDGYQRIGKLAREGKRAYLDGDWERLARMMTANHAIQRDLGGSGPENERLIKSALDAGALAAKLAGAGSGGTIIALHPDPRSLEEPLRAAGATDILYPDLQPGVQDEPAEAGAG